MSSPSTSRNQKGQCPNCGSTQIEQHDASGASVCIECGVVVEENAIVSAVEFVEGAGGASSMVGQFVSATSSKAYTSSGPGRGGYGFSRDSRETTLANGRRRIAEVASRLRLGGHYIDAAHRLFTIAVEKNFVQGRRTIHVVSACLYIACRQEKSQHMLIDFSDALQVNVYTLGTCFLKFRRLLGLKLEILDPALYVYRFAAHLDLDDKANAVALTALRLVGRMKRDWIVAGRRPAGICAAALLIAARAHGFNRQPQDVTRILRVCGMTVTTRVKEFELTPSAKLTLDQFNKVELEQEADPPVFTKNRILEARARAIQENNVELLHSGALDNPMESKKLATKWRDGKKRKKDEAFDELYKNIKDEIQTGQGPTVDMAKEHGSNQIDETDEGIASSEKTNTQKQNTEAAPATADSPAETALVVTQTLTPTKVRPASILKQASSGKRIPVSNEVCNRVTIANDKLMQIPEQWEKAYPKSKLGKAMVLPDHSTPEERHPSLVPCEGLLDTKTWKDSMPQEMVEDFDSIFLSPTEIAQKEAIFNKRNKDYIELQAQKDKIRETSEEAENQDEKEMAEQEKGHERYARKRRNRANRKGKTTGATTEEALLEAVANRKISRKINYDAMSAIFDDAGSFSTSGDVASHGALLPQDEAMIDY